MSGHPEALECIGGRLSGEPLWVPKAAVPDGHPVPPDGLLPGLQPVLPGPCLWPLLSSLSSCTRTPELRAHLNPSGLTSRPFTNYIGKDLLSKSGLVCRLWVCCVCFPPPPAGHVGRCRPLAPRVPTPCIGPSHGRGSECCLGDT